MKNHNTLIAAAAIFLVSLFVPVESTWVSSPGDDVFESHVSLHPDKAFVQQIKLPSGKITQFGVIAVPYLGEASGAIRTTIKDANENVLAVGLIDAKNLADDQFTLFDADFRHRGEATLSIEVAAPRPFLAVRTSLQNNEPGPAALEIRRQTNIYGAIADGFRARPGLLEETGIAIGIGAIVAALYFLVQGKPFKIKKMSVQRWLLVVTLLAIVVTAWRISIVDEVRGVSGGDAYNFAEITQRIIEDGQFYHPEQKRLPVFPLINSLGLPFSHDYLTIARVVNQLAAGVMILLTAVLVRQLKFSPQAALLAAILLSFNRDFLFIPFRPLAYAVLGALLLAGIVCFIASQQHKSEGKQKVFLFICSSLLLGLAAQTRQEGTVAVLLIAIAIAGYFIFKKQWKKLLVFVSPIVLLAVPYFVSNAINSGNPFYTAYQDHPVTNPRRSWHEIQDHIGQAWAVLNSTWLPRWRFQTRFPIGATVFPALVAVLAICWPATAKKFTKIKPGYVFIPTIIIGFLYLLLQLAQNGGSVREQVVLWLVVLGLAGIAVFFQKTFERKTWLFSAIVFLATFIIAGIATWVHPVDKTYVSILPYLAITTALGLHVVVKSFSTKNVLLVWIIFSVFSMPFVPLMKDFTEALDYHSRKYVIDWVRYRAAAFAAENTTGTVAVSQLHLPYTLYLKGRVQEHQDLQAEPSIQIWVSGDEAAPAGTEIFSVWNFNSDDDEIEAKVLQR